MSAMPTCKNCKHHHPKGDCETHVIVKEVDGWGRTTIIQDYFCDCENWEECTDCQ